MIMLNTFKVLLMVYNCQQIQQREINVKLIYIFTDDDDFEYLDADYEDQTEYNINTTLLSDNFLNQLWRDFCS